MSEATICTDCMFPFYSTPESLTAELLCRDCERKAMLNPTNNTLWDNGQVTLEKVTEYKDTSLPAKYSPSDCQLYHPSCSPSLESLAEIKMEPIHHNEDEIIRLKEEFNDQEKTIAELQDTSAPLVTPPEIVESESRENSNTFQTAYPDQTLARLQTGGQPRYGDSLFPINLRHPTLADLQPKARAPSRVDSISISSDDSDERMDPITPPRPWITPISALRILPAPPPKLRLDIPAYPYGPLPAEDYVPRPEPLESSLSCAIKYRFAAMLSDATTSHPAVVNNCVPSPKPTRTASTASVPRGSSAVTTAASSSRSVSQATRGRSNFSRPSTTGSTICNYRPAVSSSATRDTAGPPSRTLSGPSTRSPPVSRGMQRSETVKGPNPCPGQSSRQLINNIPRAPSNQRTSSRHPTPPRVRGTRAFNLRRQSTARPAGQPLQPAHQPSPPTLPSRVTTTPQIPAEIIGSAEEVSVSCCLGKRPSPRTSSGKKEQPETPAPEAV